MKPFMHLLYGLALLLAPLASAGAAMPAPIVDAWRVGFLVQQAPSFSTLDGRLAAAAAEARTARGPADAYFAFPAAADQRWVTGARFYLLARSGSYPGSLTLTLAVYDQAGALKRVVSRGAVDLEAAAASRWTELSLSNAYGERLVSGGEILAFHFTRSGGAAGDLLVQPIFEVTVQNFVTAYLPSIGR